MIALEKRLIESGYTKYAYDAKTRKYYKPNNHVISTMVNIDHRYVKNEEFENEIVIGLSEYKKPATLISHRNTLFVNNEMCTDDDSVNKLLQNNLDYVIKQITA